MKKILLINYYWPPCGGSAVQRWLDLTNYFFKAGISTDVVTIDDKIATFPFRDAKLNERIAPSTKVYRTGSSELFYIYNRLSGRNSEQKKQENIDITDNRFGQKFARFLRGNFFIPDPRRGWNKHALKKAAELIEENEYDAIFTAGPPQSSHLIGLSLKKKFPDIKWVADLHDYWTDNFNQQQFFRTAPAKWIDRRYEKRVLEKADLIMTHCQSSRRLLSERVAGIESKIVVHRMGYNGELFKENPYRFQKQKEFVIGYTGILAATYQPDVMLEAVSQIVRNHPSLPLRLKFAGAVSPVIIEKIKALDIDENFQYLGYVSQSDSVDLLKSSSILFLCNPKIGNDRLIVPGKIYEYLAALKPIVSISSPGSENEELISGANAGRNFDWKDLKSIYEYLNGLIEDWQQRGNIDLPDNPEIGKFERKYGAEVLINNLNL